VYKPLIKLKNKDVIKYSMRNDFDQVLALSEDHKLFIEEYFMEKSRDNSFYERMQIEQSKIIWLMSQIHKKYEKLSETAIKVTSHTEQVRNLLHETMIKSMLADTSFKHRQSFYLVRQIQDMLYPFKVLIKQRILASKSVENAKFDKLMRKLQHSVWPKSRFEEIYDKINNKSNAFKNMSKVIRR
jgi:hypothetical protein